MNEFMKKLGFENIEDVEREIAIFKAKYPERVKEFERNVKQFVDALTPDTIIGHWKQ